jgi:hypothetical protein
VQKVYGGLRNPRTGALVFPGWPLGSEAYGDGAGAGWRGSVLDLPEPRQVDFLSRVVQVAARLDAARKDLDTLTIRSRELATQLASIDDESRQVTEPKRRAGLEDANRNLRWEQKSVGLQEQQARSQEGELSQAMQLEDARWSDLISRLEQLIKR